MIARWRWMLAQLAKKLWLRATLFSLLGVATALISILLKDSIPFSLSARIGADAVDKILSIIASSMLAVTTFSLSTMVAAYGAASTGVTLLGVVSSPLNWKMNPAATRFFCMP